MEKSKIFLPGTLIPPHGFIPVPAYFKHTGWRLGSNGVWAGSQVLGLILIFVLGLLVNGHAMTNPRTIDHLMTYFLLTALPALGFLVVFANGGLDLSMGAVAALSAAVAAASMQAGTPPAAAVMLALIFSLTAGVINGALTGAARLPGLLVTLVMAVLVRGFMNLIMQGMTIGVDTQLAGLPVIGLFMLVLLTAGAFVWVQFPAFNARTPSGVSRVREAFQAGLPYVASALFAGIFGLVFANRLNAASPMMGSQVELNNVLVMVLAGVCLSSRYGNVAGVLLASLSLGLLDMVLSIGGVDIFGQNVLKAAVGLFGLGWLYLYHWIVGLIHRHVTAGKTDAAPDQDTAGGAP